MSKLSVCKYCGIILDADQTQCSSCKLVENLIRADITLIQQIIINVKKEMDEEEEHA
jgi:RNA polymerase subunit RPABC4/transcription elongation factor Spt4